MTEELELVCGHINKHFHNIKGKLEDLACTLPAGHEGDHSAKYVALRQVDDNFETAILIEGGAKSYMIAGKKYIETPEDGFWSSEASVPASEIKPDLEQLKQLRLTKNAAVS